MRESASNTSTFPVARCDTCGKTVITCIALAGDGSEARRCVHCDADIPLDKVEWISDEELEALGYHVGYRPPEETDGCRRGSCGSCSALKN